MSEALTLYEAGVTLSRAKGKNYEVVAPFTGTIATLKRDVDFGVIPGTKQPSLMKAGAQKIANAFGLLQRFFVESAIEDPDKPLFFYRVRCDLVKIASDGTEYVFTSGHGSANTNERRNGRQSAFDGANATLKMAEKRSLVAAVLSVSGLSDMFTQDMENEEFMSSSSEIVQADPDVTYKKDYGGWHFRDFIPHAIAVLAAIIAITVFILFLVRKRRKRREQQRYPNRQNR